MVQNEMTWDEKLKHLQERLSLTPDALASTLGITTRTLSDFTKRDGGREPSDPIKRLIDLLLGDGLLKQPETNLVIIHGDFRAPPGEDATDMVLQMHAAGGRPQRDNEIHYISVDPIKLKKGYIEYLVQKRAQPHLFAEVSAITNINAQDCYFSTLTVWLANQATRRNLSHITIAADAIKFWPLARELKELLDVNVTFIRETEADIDFKTLEEIEKLGINIVNPLGRKSGFVYKLIGDHEDNVSYGFIVPSDASGKPLSIANPLFFSYNHMKKGRDGLIETPIKSLDVGDLVTFSIGMNQKGACATDVALVKKNSIDISSFKEKTPKRAKSNEDSEFVSILRDAVEVCADEGSWALQASVGSRISVLYPNFKNRLQEEGYSTIKEFVEAHPNQFEYSAVGVGSYNAACLRLKKP